MDKKTINSAIIYVLRNSETGLSARQIFDRIVEQNLYSFKATQPYSVLRAQLRKHTEGYEFPKAQREKLFKLSKDGSYILK